MSFIRDDMLNIYGKGKAPAQAAAAPKVVQGISLVHVERREEDSAETTWIYSFADLILNLLMFFVMLTAISSVDKSKLEAIQQAMGTKAAAPKKAKDEAREVKETRRQSSSTPEKLSNTEIIDQIKKLLSQIDKKAFDRDKENQAVFALLETEIGSMANKVGGLVTTDPDKDSFEVILSAPRLFTPTDDLSESGRVIIEKLAEGFEKVTTRLYIIVQAFTSPLPGPERAGALASNTLPYAITSKRAVQIVAALQRSGLSQSHLLAAAGLGPLQPVVDRSSTLNERLVIRIARLADKGEPKTFREKAR